MIADNIRNDAVLSAEETANQFKILRGYYTKHIVGKVLATKALKPSINHKTEPGSIPLPATLIHDLSELLKDRDISAKLYSPFPFPNKSSRKLDSFQSEAWNTINANPERPFVREEIDDAGRTIIRVGIADRMVDQACVDCHNSRADTPKNDWNLNDVRGVLEIATVIDARLAAGAVVSRRIFMGGTLVASALSFILIFLLIRIVARPLRTLGGSMNRLAGGDKIVDVPLTERLDEIGEMARTVAVFKDNLIKNEQLQIEQRHAEDQLRQAQKMEAVGQLTGGIAHDFNNMLAATMANAEILEYRLQGQDGLIDLAQSIIETSRRGAELTQRLLAFSRNQILQPQSVHLETLYTEMSNLIKSSVGGSIQIRLTADREAWNVMADPGQIENALLNLSLNAGHAMPNGGTLTIRIENALVTDVEWAEQWEGQPGEYGVLRVIDTGTGMPAHVLEQAFEPFFTTKETGQGSGLGLSMVYGFAQQTGGFATIESDVQKGTTVSIYLPKAKSEHGPRDVAKAKPEPLKGRNEVILLVEDEAAVRAATAAILKILDYKVLTAEDGPSALEIASKADRIDFLLSDMVLPGGMNGVEIYHQLRCLWPDLKCLFMSGYTFLDDQQLPEGIELLTKPFAIAEMAANLRQALDA